MDKKKVLDETGLRTLVTSIKNGDLEVGKVKDGGSVPASAIKGIINVSNLPKSALERLVIVADDQARFALTTEQIQLGDTCKVQATGVMYYVTDDAKLSTEEGWEPYTAGVSAEAVHAESADYATEAGSAAKATQDGSGNVITTTYAKVSNVATKVQGDKADTAVQSIKIGVDNTELKNGTNVVLPAYPVTLPASDVSAWAKADAKPTYNGTEIKLTSAYAKPASASAVSASDTIQAAIGKVEKQIDAKLSASTAETTYVKQADLVALTDAEILAMF